MISLVGHHHGRKIIRWGYVIVAFLLVTISASLGAVGIYAVFTKVWNPLVLWVGPVAGVLVTVPSLAVSFRTPPQRLPFLKPTNLP
jgi:uncharacterized membrane protein YagU involved in acid resistance